MSVGLRDFVHIIMSLSILIMVENHIEFSRVSFSIHYLPKVHSKLRSLHNNTLNIQGKGCAWRYVLLHMYCIGILLHIVT